jgi:O-antigen ligase
LGAVEGVIGVYQSITGTGAGYGGETIRAVGTFGPSAQISMATVVSCAQLVLLAVAIRGRPGVRLWAATGAAALMIPLALSLSRGALLASLIAAVVMLLCTGIVRAAVTIVIVVAAAILALSLTGGLNGTVGARIGTIGTAATAPDSSVQDRYDLWATAVSIWQQSPVTGVGIKQFPAYRDTYAPVGMSSGSDEASPEGYDRAQLLSPHNQYLLLLSEQGVLGLGAYALLQVVLGARHFALLRAPPRGQVHVVLRLVALGIFIRFLVDDLYGDLAGSTAVLYSVLLGIQLRSAVSHRTPLFDERSPGDEGATAAGG